MPRQNIVLSENLEQHLTAAISELQPDRCFVLTDTTTQRLCLPLLQDIACLQEAGQIVIPADDTNKTLQSVVHVWEELQRHGATRHSLLVCLGGGMVTDLGGFAASTFKRGIHLINIPTTLLAMVDASVGGKTGFNFGGLKNEIGVFRDAETVILDTVFLQTLDMENLLSGYAEMLKHGLISDEQRLGQLLTFDVEHITTPDNLDKLRSLLADSVKVKERIVEEDPTEKGLRKALNLGHTVGHAFESLAMTPSSTTHHPSAISHQPSAISHHLSPILHGYAVAFGLICELYLSCIKTGFPTDSMRQVVSFIHGHYGTFPITCDDYPALLELMTHDKKNVAGEINFTLLGGVGDIRINQTVTTQEIEQALDFFRDGC